VRGPTGVIEIVPGIDLEYPTRFSAPTYVLLNITPPIEFEVVEVVVTLPVTANVDPLNVKLEFATAAFEDVDDAVVST
jgi:hypothetical protein